MFFHVFKYSFYIKRENKMLVRKYTYRPDGNEVEDLIELFENEMYDSTHPLAQQFLNSQHIRQHFHQLHECLTLENFIIADKMTVLEEGIYILLKGQVNYYSPILLTEKQKTFSKRKTNFKNIRSTLISNSFSIFTASHKNCTIFQMSYLLKITDDQALRSKFYQYFNRRKQLCDLQYFSQDHLKLMDNPSIIYGLNGPYIMPDMNLHYNFYFKLFHFREKIIPTCHGIICEGSIKLKITEGSHQISQFGLVLPNLTYESTSSLTKVMFIQNTDNIGIKFKQSFTQKVQYQQNHCKNNKLLTQMDSNVNQSISLYNKNVSNHLPLSNPYDKEVTRLSKITQPFTIISTYKCERSIDFAKRYYKKQLNCNKNVTKAPKSFFKSAIGKQKLQYPQSVNSTNRVISKESPKKKSFNNKYILQKLHLPIENYRQMVDRYQRSMKTIAKQHEDSTNRVKTYGFEYNIKKSQHVSSQKQRCEKKLKYYDL